MKDDAWGILLQYVGGQYHTFLAAEPFIYERVKASKEHGIHFIAGKQGILSEDIGSIASRFSELVKRLNTGEQIDIKIELETIVKDAEIAESVPQPMPTEVGRLSRIPRFSKPL